MFIRFLYHADNDLPITQYGWEWSNVASKEWFKDAIVPYVEKLNDCLKRMKEDVKEHNDYILMYLECWNMIVSNSGESTL